MTIAILGGTGPQGRGLAKRFAAAGVPVAIGSRRSEHAEEVAGELTAVLPAKSASINGYDNAGAIAAADEMVILAVPWQGHNQTLESLKMTSLIKFLLILLSHLRREIQRRQICLQKARLLKQLKLFWAKKFQSWVLFITCQLTPLIILKQLLTVMC